MKKIFCSISILFFSFATFSQTLTYQTFDFPEFVKIKTDTLGTADATAITINEKRCLNYIYSKKSELEKYYFFYKKVYLKSDKGVEENNKIYLPGAELSDIILFKARALNASGKIITEQLRSDLKTEEDKESGKYFKCAVEGLKPDMFLEFFYMVKVYAGIYGKEYLQTKQQKLKVDYEIISPINLVFEGKIYNGGNASFKKGTDTTKNSIACTLYNIPEETTEEYSAGDANLTRVEYKMAYNHAIDKARRQTWEGAGITYYNAYHNDIPSSKALKKLIKEENIAKKSSLEKIYFIEQFIKTGIVINENSPYETPDDILKYRVASLTSIMRFMVAYFRELNINYEIYMTSSRSERPLDKSFDSWSYLESVLFYFPDEDKYMMPKNYALRLGQVPFDFAATDALNIKEMKIGSTAKGLSSIKHLPSSSREKNTDTLIALITFKNDFSGVEIKETKKISGYMAENVRPFYYYSDNTKKDDYIKEYVKLGDENMTVSNAKVKNYDYANYVENVPFEIECTVSKPMVERSGDKLMLKVGDVIGRQAELYQEKKRINDIDVHYPHQYIRKIQVNIPKGYRVANLSSAEIKFSFKDDSGKDLMRFVSAASEKDGVITIDIDEHYAFTQLSKSRFEDFKKVINAAADFNKVILIFEPVK